MSSDDALPPQRFGFVGTGAIATAIVRGLLRGVHAGALTVTVSPRSASNASALAKEFPDKVTIAASNQAVVDASDTVFLAVLPPQLPEVLAELTFRPDGDRPHSLVSVVSTSKLSMLADTTRVPATRVWKMICLPSVQTCQGTCLLTPKGQSPVLRRVFDSLGGTVECATEEQMANMMIPTCSMGPFFKLLATQQEWLVKHGVPPEDASYFVGRSFKNMADNAEAGCKDPAHIPRLVEENTPGGINEQAIRNLGNYGVWDAYNASMDGIIERIKGAGTGDRAPAAGAPQ